MKKFLIAVLALSFFVVIETAHAEPLWLILPPTPTLPKPEKSGFAPINGTKMWYAIFGHGKPVILLHGGLANSNYWGNQVPELAKHYKVVVMDSRGQGRSENNGQPIGYDLMSSDVIQLMNYLNIKQAAIVGWSDGAIIGLDMAIHYPTRIAKLFAFAANSNTDGGNPTVTNSSVFNAYIARTKPEYEKLSETPTQYPALNTQINKMWASQPDFTQAQLHSIKTPTWIVDGQYDEGIKRESTEYMAAQIPNAGLLIQPNVSHFSFLQNPKQFNQDVLNFLQSAPGY